MSEYVPRPPEVKKPRPTKPQPRWGTEQWIKEEQESKQSVKRYFMDTVGPYDPNALNTVKLSINPKSGLLENITPEDQRPIEDTTGLFQKKDSMGLTASSPKKQTDFLQLVPTEPEAEKPELKGRQPQKITPSWHSDPEQIMEIAADPYKRKRALGSDAQHEAMLHRRALRKELGLPEKAPPWKETLQRFHAFTEEDKNILRGMGYHPERVRNPYSMTVECMLRDLQQYRESTRS